MNDKRSIERQKLKVLNLLRQDSYLLCSMFEAEEDRYYLCVRKSDGIRPLCAIDQAIFEEFKAHQMIKPISEGWCLSKTGKMQLKRYQAKADHFQEQHQRRVQAVINHNGVNQPVIKNICESPLSWLYSRRDKKGRPFLNDQQFAAGERLRTDFEKGHMNVKVTTDWSRLATANGRQKNSPRDGLSTLDSAIMARKRLEQAFDDVGPELSGILIEVCCHLKGLEEAERRYGWPRRSGKVILRMALNELARHYGLVKQERRHYNLQPPMQHWGAEDYRPKIDES